MSSSEATAHAAPGRGDPHLAHHFDTQDQQDGAVRLGMWLFLGTEVLLFAGLFLGYTVYRHFFHEAFHECSRALSLPLGTLNTVILITSSLFVALAHVAIKQDKQKQAAGLLVLTILCALAFLVIKSFEYAHKFEVGELPGKWFSNPEITAPGANLYFTVYFLATGLHAFHVIVGMSVLAWVLKGVLKGKYGPRNNVAVELGGLYWHLVDLVWIFLFPLLYLI
ncbi:MAG TPA: cytochrome c oxidase subunit 3 family protein [Polyangia bacterium]|nr:cytochrome c oxidase subunit 3 family protein [Polyangia bacterium]